MDLDFYERVRTGKKRVTGKQPLFKFLLKDRIAKLSVCNVAAKM